jgi:ATP-dependent Clp protease protease subunit
MNKIELIKSIPSNRIIRLLGNITEKTGIQTINKLLDLDALNTNEILIYIYSVGGYVLPGFSIVNTMRLIKSPIITVASGAAKSTASWILMSGSKGLRFVDPYASVFIHNVYFSIKMEQEIKKYEYDENINCNNSVAKIISATTGQSIAKVRKDMKNETFFSAQEALEYGIVDHIC